MAVFPSEVGGRNFIIANKKKREKAKKEERKKERKKGRTKERKKKTENSDAIFRGTISSPSHTLS